MRASEGAMTAALEAGAAAAWAADSEPDGASPWSEVDKVTKHKLRDALLVPVVAACEALPDERAVAWEEGFEAGHTWDQVGPSGIPSDPPDNPYRSDDAPPAGEDPPRPWGEHERPTPQQLSEWLRDCSEATRLTIVEAFLRDAEVASRCFVQNHEGLREDLLRAQRRNACTGAATCGAVEHVHGCYADLDGSACDDPGDHEVELRVRVGWLASAFEENPVRGVADLEQPERGVVLVVGFSQDTEDTIGRCRVTAVSEPEPSERTAGGQAILDQWLTLTVWPTKAYGPARADLYGSQLVDGGIGVVPRDGGGYRVVVLSVDPDTGRPEES